MVFSNFARQNPEDSPSAQIRKPYMRKTGIILAAAITICLCAASCGNRKGGKKVADEQKDSITMVQNSEPEFDIITTEGTIRVKLYSKTPRHRDNFCKLVSEHYYDSLLFHRVINGFMIQGGGHTADMQEKANSRKPVVNEAGNGLKNDAYTIAMARTNDPDSATAQFFINVANNDFLNHKNETPSGYGYAVFGKVIQGQDVVDRIKSVSTGSYGPYQDVPKTPVIIKSIVPVQ